MEIVNAYELVGTYRAAAALCGTTAKTVKRVLERRVSDVRIIAQASWPPQTTNATSVSTRRPPPRFRDNENGIGFRRLAFKWV
ncbi:MAG: hypothetical protein NVSMB2_28020 [Chloroflexota bacterium]